MSLNYSQIKVMNIIKKIGWTWLDVNLQHYSDAYKWKASKKISLHINVKFKLITLKGLPAFDLSAQTTPSYYRLPGIFELVLFNFAALDLSVYWHAPHTSIIEWQTAKHSTWRADWQTCIEKSVLSCIL